jgi:hypothetical protein
MTTFEADTIAGLTTLFEKVNELSALNIRDLLLPDKYKEFGVTLDAAYDALVQVEDALDSLGMKLEYHHWRVSSAFEELTPFHVPPRSLADIAVEIFEQNMQRKEGRLFP